MLLYNKKTSLYFTFGRFQPITTAHEDLFNFMSDAALTDGSDYIICISPTQDYIKNVLSWEERMEYLATFHPHLNINKVKEGRLDNIIINFVKQGYTHLNFVVGKDRVNDFKWIYKYKDEMQYSTFNIIEYGDRDKNPVSATQARQAALSGNFDLFREILSKSINDAAALGIYLKIRERIHEI